MAKQLEPIKDIKDKMLAERFSARSYWAIYEGMSPMLRETGHKPELKDIVIGDYEQAVEFAFKQDYFLKVDGESNTHPGRVEPLHVKVHELPDRRPVRYDYSDGK